MAKKDYVNIVKEYFTLYGGKSNAYIAGKILDNYPTFPVKERMIRYELVALRAQKWKADDNKGAIEGVKDLQETGSETKKTLSGSISSKQTDRVKILDEFLIQTKVDLKKYKIKEYKIRAWDVTMKVKEDNVSPGRTYTNYYIAVSLEPIAPDEFDQEEFMRYADEMMSKYTSSAPEIQYKKAVGRTGENLLALSINDLHLGRYTWEDESGVDSNTELAAENMINGINELVESANMESIDRILYYVGHDYFTIDKVRPFAATANGTPQDVDMRWQKLFQVGEELQIKAIKYLSTIAPVDVQLIPGNHDLQTSFYLGRVLKAVFENNPNVNVNAGPSVRKYYRWGENNILGSHGKYEKPYDVHAIMMAEDRKNMGDTKYWYAIFGHQHHFIEKQVKTVLNYKGLKTISNVNEDYKGLTITYLPNLSHRDDYEVEKCYVGTIRSAMAMVFNTKKGRTATYQHNL